MSPNVTCFAVLRQQLLHCLVSHIRLSFILFFPDFHIGQLYNSPRDSLANVHIDDPIETTTTTKGYLSNGNSHPITVNGYYGNDYFDVLRNLQLVVRPTPFCSSFPYSILRGAFLLTSCSSPVGLKRQFGRRRLCSQKLCALRNLRKWHLDRPRHWKARIARVSGCREAVTSGLFRDILSL